MKIHKINKNDFKYDSKTQIYTSGCNNEQYIKLLEKNGWIKDNNLYYKEVDLYIATVKFKNAKDKIISFYEDKNLKSEIFLSFEVNEEQIKIKSLSKCDYYILIT